MVRHLVEYKKCLMPASLFDQQMVSLQGDDESPAKASPKSCPSPRGAALSFVTGGVGMGPAAGGEGLCVCVDLRRIRWRWALSRRAMDLKQNVALAVPVTICTPVSLCDRTCSCAALSRPAPMCHATLTHGHVFEQFVHQAAKYQHQGRGQHEVRLIPGYELHFLLVHRMNSTPKGGGLSHGSIVGHMESANPGSLCMVCKHGTAKYKNCWVVGSTS